MLHRFENDTRLGAAGFSVYLPRGGQECSALPHVFVGCGVGLRASALRAAGGLDRSFFMQAEEYDLAFRLAAAGWKVRAFDDLQVDHLKTSQARRSARTTYYDIRNNLRVLARWLPSSHYGAYRADTIQRYWWLAQRNDQRMAFLRGLSSGLAHSVIERQTYASRRLNASTFESFYRCDSLRIRMDQIAREGIRAVVFATLGKNIFAFYQAAVHAGVRILAIGDDRFAGEKRRYRGIRVLPLEQAVALTADATVVSDSARVFAEQTAVRLQRLSTQPVFDWFGGGRTARETGFNSTIPPRTSDDTPADHRPAVVLGAAAE
jgi:hypothetical protein